MVSFNSATPGTFLTNVPLSGITAGEGVLGIDFRPATGQLYAISGSTSVASTGTVYTVNLATGALSTVGTAGNTGLMPGNTSSRVSLDFNPVVDRMRVVTGNRQNYRFNPNTRPLSPLCCLVGAERLGDVESERARGPPDLTCKLPIVPGCGRDHWPHE